MLAQLQTIPMNFGDDSDSESSDNNGEQGNVLNDLQNISSDIKDTVYFDLKLPMVQHKNLKNDYTMEVVQETSMIGQKKKRKIKAQLKGRLLSEGQLIPRDMYDKKEMLEDE